MKLIKPSVEIREQREGLDGMYEHIEWAGRHCYKSHDKTTATSAKEFVGRIANRVVTAVCWNMAQSTSLFQQTICQQNFL